jgi:hypothetical protein
VLSIPGKKDASSLVEVFGWIPSTPVLTYVCLMLET